MIHILLLILKVIGIVLPAVLMLAAFILFFPVSYKITGFLEEKDYNIKVKAIWLFGIVRFGFLKNNLKEKYSLRILGIPVLKYPKKEKNVSFEDGETEKYDESKQNDATLKAIDENGEVNQNFEEKKYDAGNVQHDKETTEHNQHRAIHECEKNKVEKSNFIKKIKTLFEKVINTVKAVLKNIKDTKDKIIEIKKFITANTTKEAYRYGKRIIIKIIKHILPYKVSGNVHFGFETPDMTGKTLGYIAIAFGTFNISPKHIKIAPDFENKVLDGNIKIKGRIFLGVIGIYLLKLYMKKEIRSIIKKMK